MKKSFIVTKLNLPKIAELIIKIIAVNQNNIILLCGDLGSGKTTLTKFICQKLGYDKNISSPTFVISKIYKLKNKQIIHYDLYRLGSMEELLEIGFLEAITNTNDIKIIEWPSKINKLESFLKENKAKFVKIFLEHIDVENKRKITISYDK